MALTNKKIQRIKPLRKPAFGVPYGGRLCTSCDEWYDRKWFWIAPTKSYDSRCIKCRRGLGG